MASSAAMFAYLLFEGRSIFIDSQFPSLVMANCICRCVGFFSTGGNGYSGKGIFDATACLHHALCLSRKSSLTRTHSFSIVHRLLDSELVDHYLAQLWLGYNLAKITRVIPRMLDLSLPPNNYYLNMGRRRGDVMQLSNWSEYELVALARVYIKHKQFNRSENVRREISQRLSESADENTAQLSDLLDELNALQVTPLTQRLRSLFVTTRQVA